MEFDEQMELGHFVLTERKCRVCGKVKELIDGFYLIRKNKVFSHHIHTSVKLALLVE